MRKTTSAGGVVLSSEGKVLVVDQNGDSWSLPKGHPDEGETLLEAAKREITEESGIEKLKLIKRLGSYQRYRIGKNGVGEDKSELKKIHFFLFTTSQKTLKPRDRENQTAIWVNKENVATKLTHPKDSQFFNKVIGEIIF